MPSISNKNVVKLRKQFYACDYGVVADGVTDDTTAIRLAIQQSRGHTLNITGTPLISERILINESVHLAFDGLMADSVALPGSYFIKKATGLTYTAIEVTAPGFLAVGGGVVGQVGDLGKGIEMAAPKCHWISPYVTGMGDDGIWLGKIIDPAPALLPCAGMRLDNPICSSNGRDGIVVSDVNNTGNDCIILGPTCQNNGRYGMRPDQYAGNLLVINIHAEGNTSYGIYAIAGARTIFLLGDSEQNGWDGAAWHDVYINSAALGTVLLNLGTTSAVEGGGAAAASGAFILNSLDLNGDLQIGNLQVNPIAGTGGPNMTVGDNNEPVLTLNHYSVTLPRGLWVEYTAAAPNNAANFFYYAKDTATVRFKVNSDGGIHNYQANDANLSDEALKKDWSPLASYWDKWKALEFGTYLHKDQTDKNRNIGLIAQQVERVAPEFVTDTVINEAKRSAPGKLLGKDGKPLDPGGVVLQEEQRAKALWTTDMYMAMGKVVQELQAEVEKLKAKLA